MKDSFVYSFRDPEPRSVRKVIHKDEKDRVISGRKMEELNRVNSDYYQDIRR